MATTAVRASPLPTSNKRKRGPGDQDGGRNTKAVNTNGNNAMSDPSYAPVDLIQGLGHHAMIGVDDSSRTAQAALATPLQDSGYPEPGNFEGLAGTGSSLDDINSGQNMDSTTGMFDTPQSGNKPTVGSDEWHNQRKNNHKEVERRRREVINEGIENIAKLVPNVEKNKGAILARTQQYITEMQHKERKLENERSTVEMAIKELTNRNDKLKAEAQKAWADSNKWQQRCRDAGLQFDDYDDGGLVGIDIDDAVEESYGR